MLPEHQRLVTGRQGVAGLGDTLSSGDQPLVLRQHPGPQHQRLVTGRQGVAGLGAGEPRPATPCSSGDQPLVHAGAAAAASRSQARAKADEDKLVPGALSVLAAEDPTLRIEHNSGDAPGRPVVHGRGARRRPARAGSSSVYGAAVDQLEVRGGAAADLHRRVGKGHGRHVKQSGGHGQFAVVRRRGRAASPRRRAFEFVDKVVGGAVPRQFVPSRREGRCGRRWSGGSVDGLPAHRPAR